MIYVQLLLPLLNPYLVLDVSILRSEKITYHNFHDLVSLDTRHRQTFQMSSSLLSLSVSPRTRPAFPSIKPVLGLICKSGTLWLNWTEVESPDFCKTESIHVTVQFTALLRITIHHNLSDPVIKHHITHVKTVKSLVQVHQQRGKDQSSHLVYRAQSRRVATWSSGWLCWCSPAWAPSPARPGRRRSSPCRRRLWTEKTLTWVRWKSV